MPVNQSNGNSENKDEPIVIDGWKAVVIVLSAIGVLMMFGVLFCSSK